METDNLNGIQDSVGTSIGRELGEPGNPEIEIWNSMEASAMRLMAKAEAAGD